MKEFHCAGVVPGCGASFRAATADELIARGRVPAAAHHDVHGTDYPPQLEAFPRACLRDVV